MSKIRSQLSEDIDVTDEAYLESGLKSYEEYIDSLNIPIDHDCHQSPDDGCDHPIHEAQDE